MADLVCYIPNHGFPEETPVFISWLGGNYYISDPDANSFKLATTAGGAVLVQFTETITDGYVREVDLGGATTTISGLDHLEGETVLITSAGEVVAGAVVADGSVTVTSDIYTYQVGIPYTMKVRTMRLSIPSESETLQSRIKRIHELVVRYIKSANGKAGQEYGGTEYLSDLDASYSSNANDMAILNKGGFNEEAYTIVVSDGPFPFTLLSTIVSFEVQESR